MQFHADFFSLIRLRRIPLYLPTFPILCPHRVKSLSPVCAVRYNLRCCFVLEIMQVVSCFLAFFTVLSPLCGRCVVRFMKNVF